MSAYESQSSMLRDEECLIKALTRCRGEVIMSWLVREYDDDPIIDADLQQFLCAVETAKLRVKQIQGGLKDGTHPNIYD